ncbi:MAG: MFS transporter, partial [Candidatus Dormibacteraceae bacterium]
GPVLAVDAASFLAITLAAATIQKHRVAAGSRPGAVERAEPGSGFSVLRADPLLLAVFGGLAAVVLLVGMVDVVLVYLVRETLRAPAWWFGFASAGWMLGMVGGALGSARLGTASRRAVAVVLGVGLASAALGCYAAAPAAWVLVPLGVLGGIGNGMASACLATLLLTRTRERLRGRMSAVVNAGFGAAQGASLVAGGLLAIVLAPRLVFAIGGFLGLLATIGMAVATRSALKREGAAAPAPARGAGPAA